MGALLSNSFDPSKDLPSLRGKVIIVTGGNRGIGFETVRHLARRGAKVYIGARDETRAIEAIARLKAEDIADGEVHWLNLDLSDPGKAKRAAQEFMSKENRLDVLVNNAGLTTSVAGEKGVGGIQTIMIVNHLSPFVFTETLSPVLKRTAEEPNSDVRIVNVSSLAQSWVPSTVRFQCKDDLNRQFGIPFVSSCLRYGLSKLANVLWTKELQKKYDTEGFPITAMVVHPGAVNTDGSMRLLNVYRLGFIAGWFYCTPEVGAYTSLFAAASPAVKNRREEYKGAYLWPVGKVTYPLQAACNPQLAEELWYTTEAVLREMGID